MAFPHILLSGVDIINHPETGLIYAVDSVCIESDFLIAEIIYNIGDNTQLFAPSDIFAPPCAVVRYCVVLHSGRPVAIDEQGRAGDKPRVVARKEGDRDDVPMRPDNVPTMADEDNSALGYHTKGRLFAIGYMRGLRERISGSA
jgi:hypothetical protein